MVAVAAVLDYLPPFEEASSLEVAAEPCRCELLDGLLDVDTDTEKQLRHVADIDVVDIAAGMMVVDTAVDTCLAVAVDIEVHILVAVVGKGMDC